MTRETYQQSLVELRADVTAMGETVVERLGMAIDSLATGDEAVAREVIDGDSAVNETYLELERRCIELVALQQPVASDLRFVAASFKISTDIERIGDLATNLAQYALAADRTFTPDVGLDEIGRDATELVERSLEAYANGDADACREIAARDDEIDALCQRANHAVARDLIEEEALGDAWAVEELLDDVSRVLLTIRDLERVADHAVNIAARTLYAVENDTELIY
ncbi:phosphate transport system protein [Halopelagius inordinatus]|uniref:Phosphate-specific transport system accessory protein PhoU n=1 Tax=Halopelagius inordinatus TaxID=553467 RepID=A0A1I2RSS3_9EURY|nr:phosphate signaling complex protein PhoU [Halopelagius inordinatus]SFG43578.1 phosphate transport system protein [Halopelagius inordinatus]